MLKSKVLTALMRRLDTSLFQKILGGGPDLRFGLYP